MIVLKHPDIKGLIYTCFTDYRNDIDCVQQTKLIEILSTKVIDSILSEKAYVINFQMKG